MGKMTWNKISKKKSAMSAKTGQSANVALGTSVSLGNIASAAATTRKTTVWSDLTWPDLTESLDPVLHFLKKNRECPALWYEST